MSTEDLEPFDLLGPLPTGTTVLEASAGTGKTHTIAALVVRYVVEGVARLEDLLVVTFGRMATVELRDRVRAALVEADRMLATPETADASPLLAHLVAVDAAELHARSRRVADALASFDAATIATTHQFCHLVLRSLGVAGDTDPQTTLVEDLHDLVDEVVDDLYLRAFGQSADPPAFTPAEARELGRAAVADPQSELVVGETADGPADGSVGVARVAFARDVRSEVERRKRRRGVLGYDDLLSRLAEALDRDDSPAAARMRARWTHVLVDEFQDTDPVQWQVFERAFHGHSTLVLIGDPKQAIYAFRGGDIVTYLQARRRADRVLTLPTNYRSDAPLVSALQVLTRHAALGDPEISVHAIDAHLQGSRLVGAPVDAPIRARVVSRAGFSTNRSDEVRIADLRPHIAEDLADDIARLLASGATYDGKPIGAGDIAVLMYSLKQAPLFTEALRERGIPSVINGGDGVLATAAAGEWITLLEALEQPQRTSRLRSLALSPFVGLTPADLGALGADGDDVTDRVAERVRGWLDLFRLRGIAAVHESIVADGLAARVLARPDGERLLTDLTHVGQVLHEVSHDHGFGLVALLDWLRSEQARHAKERTRRLDTEDNAVQFVTIHRSKGLQYPIVHLPVAFDCWPGRETAHLYHRDGRRVLDLSGGPAPEQARLERAGEELRLTYVALTRAQSQVVLWLGPSSNSRHGGITRLLLGREPDEAHVPPVLPGAASDAAVDDAMRVWQDAGGLLVEESVVTHEHVALDTGPDAELAVRRFDRDVDVTWRRTSYSGLIRAESSDTTMVRSSEPEREGTVDEPDQDEPPEPAPARDAPPELDDVPSPMDTLPGGATFGSLVHAVLEHTDPAAPDLAAEIRRHVEEQLRWWSVEATPDALTEGLLPMQLSPLGPLADGRRLVDIGLEDRLCELDFEFPLTGGDDPRPERVRVEAIADVLERRLGADDPMREYAARLRAPSLGGQVLRGYLNGSIDVVLRVGGADPRFVIVDYKTNRLGTPGEPLTAFDYTPAAVTAAMLHSHYPLQALIYSVALHRYLRWRLGAEYDPRRHLGGVCYLYLRGMCGAQTPVIDGHPCGVFSWRPPAGLVTDLSDLFAGGGS